MGSGGSDTGTADTGVADTGVTDTGAADTGAADTGVTDTGAADTATADTEPDTTLADTNVTADTDTTDTDVTADTGEPDTSPDAEQDTGAPDAGPEPELITLEALWTRLVDDFDNSFGTSTTTLYRIDDLRVAWIEDGSIYAYEGDADGVVVKLRVQAEEVAPGDEIDVQGNWFALSLAYEGAWPRFLDSQVGASILAHRPAQFDVDTLKTDVTATRPLIWNDAGRLLRVRNQVITRTRGPEVWIGEGDNQTLIRDPELAYQGACVGARLTMTDATAVLLGRQRVRESTIYTYVRALEAGEFTVEGAHEGCGPLRVLDVVYRPAGPSLQIILDNELDPVSVPGSGVTLAPSVGTSNVRAWSNAILVDLDAPLDPETSYTLILGDGPESRAGRRLPANTQWTLATEGRACVPSPDGSVVLSEVGSPLGLPLGESLSSLPTAPYVEVTNHSDVAVDMTGWQLQTLRYATEDHNVTTPLPAFTLEPCESMILSGRDEATTMSNWGQPLEFLGSVPHLSRNGYQGIVLIDAQGMGVDKYPSLELYNEHDLDRDTWDALPYNYTYLVQRRDPSILAHPNISNTDVPPEDQWIAYPGLGGATPNVR